MRSQRIGTLCLVAAAGLLLAVSVPPSAGLAAVGGNGNGGDHGSSGGDHGASGTDHGASGTAGGASGSAGVHDDAHGQLSSGALASAAGALNAAHASPTALSHAAAGSRVGQISSYDRVMLAALTMPSATPAQITARNAAIAAARTQLAAASNKTLTPAVVAHIDRLLGLPSTDPTLGTRQGGI